MDNTLQSLADTGDGEERNLGVCIWQTTDYSPPSSVWYGHLPAD